MSNLSLNKQPTPLTSLINYQIDGDLESSSDMWEGNNLMVKGLLNGVTVNLHVLHAFVVDRIENNLDGTSVVSMPECRLNLGKAK